MALEPYVNKTGIDARARQVDTSLPGVGSVDLNRMADKIMQAAEPHLQAKAKKDAVEHATSAGVARDEEGNYIRPKPVGGGAVYRQTFEAITRDLMVDDIDQRFQERLQQFRNDPTLKYDPEAFLAAAEGARIGVMENLDPDVAVKVDEVLRRELLQHYNGLSGQVRAKEEQAAVNGIVTKLQKYSGEVEVLTKLLMEFPEDTDLRAKLTLAEGLLDYWHKRGLDMKAISPDQELNPTLSSELILVDRRVTQQRAAAAFFAPMDIEKDLTDEHLVILGQLDEFDVNPGLEYDIPGHGKLTVQSIRAKFGDEGAKAIARRAREILEIRQRRADELARGDEKAEADRQREARENWIDNIAILNGVYTEDQKRAIDSSIFEDMGGVSPDGQQISPERMQSSFDEMMDPRNTARGTVINKMVHTQRVPPGLQRLMINRIATRTGNPDSWKPVVTFLRTLREAGNRRGENIGTLLIGDLDPKLRTAFLVADEMMRLFPEHDGTITAKLDKLADGTVDPKGYAGRIYGEQHGSAGKPGELNPWDTASLKALRGELGSDFQWGHANRALLYDYQQIANIYALAGNDINAVPEMAAKHLSRTWAKSSVFPTGYGPRKLVNTGLDAGALDWLLSKPQFLRLSGLPSNVVQNLRRFSFRGGSLKLQPKRVGDPGSGWGEWSIIVVGPNGRLGSQPTINMDKIVRAWIMTKEEIARKRAERAPQVLRDAKQRNRQPDRSRPIPVTP